MGIVRSVRKSFKKLLKTVKRLAVSIVDRLWTRMIGTLTSMNDDIDSQCLTKSDKQSKPKDDTDLQNTPESAPFRKPNDKNTRKVIKTPSNDKKTIKRKSDYKKKIKRETNESNL